MLFLAFDVCKNIDVIYGDVKINVWKKNWC